MAAWIRLFDQARPAFAQQRTFERARTLGLSALACLGRRTVSGLLCTAGQQFQDWSAAYRLFERQRMEPEQLWTAVQQQVLGTLPPEIPVVALIDDTLIRKRGQPITGTSWQGDPLGPPFAGNFIWASRFLEISVAAPQHPQRIASPARAVPVDLLPTPEQHPRDESPPWQSVRAFAAGNYHHFEIKTIGPVRWKHAGGDRQLRLLIVRPIAYRLRKGGALNYRQPAYLIYTDPTLSPQRILQAYLWRWEIELNFRDEKTLLGCGKPQVRTEPAVRSTTAFFVFVYALLLLALQQCQLIHSPLPLPCWHRIKPKRPNHCFTTSQALSLFRACLWSATLGLRNKNGFAAIRPITAKPLLIQSGLQSAVLYASG